MLLDVILIACSSLIAILFILWFGACFLVLGILILTFNIVRGLWNLIKKMF